MIEHARILKQARRSVKGLFLHHLQPILLLGEYPDGLRGIEVAELTGKSQQNVWKIYNKCARAGFIRKENKRYYLTDSGQQVYNTICREFDQSLKLITRAILEDAGL